MNPLNQQEEIRDRSIRNQDSGWYAIQVFGGQEHIVKNLILRQFSEKNEELIQECFIPMRERKLKYQGTWHVIQERILPGYVFVISKDPEKVFHRLKGVPRFTGMLGKTDAGFIALNEKEVQFLGRFGGTGHVSRLSKVAVEKGNKVRILEGDLKNFEGEIVKMNLHKRVAIVSVPFMGNNTNVYLGIDIVEKLD